MAHPNALEVLEEDLFWDQSNEFAPFGNDEGYDAFYSFRRWLQDHPDGEAAEYLQERATYQGVPLGDLELENVSGLEEGRKYSLIEDLDWEAIAICFAQFILKGYISDRAKQIGIKAVRRQMDDHVLKCLIPNQSGREERKELLQIQLKVLKKLHSST